MVRTKMEEGIESLDYGAGLSFDGSLDFFIGSVSALFLRLLLGAIDSAKAGALASSWGHNFESIVHQTGLKYAYRDGKERARITLTRWVFTFFIGTITALIAVGILVGTERLSQLKVSLTKRMYDDHQHLNAFLVWCGSSMGFVLIASLLVVLLEPVAAGSGIPEVKSYLNGVKIPRLVRLRTLLAKAIGVTFAVAGGLPVGKEGPMIHTGAVVGAGISQGKSSTLGYDTSFSIFSPFRNDREKRDFVSCGAAAGVAAAFGAPIGGVLFVLEEGASFWHRQLTWRTFFCSLISSFTVSVVLSGIQPGQKFGELGTMSGTFTFGEVYGGSYQIYEVPLFILMGVGGGLLGAVFNSLNTKITQWRARWIRSSAHGLFEVLTGSLLIAMVCFVFSYLFGQCRPRPEKIYAYSRTEERHTLQDNRYKEDMVGFFCANPEKEYNDAATLFMTSGEKAIRQLLHASEGTFSVGVLLLFFLSYFSMACWTYGTKVPSGLFVPALLTGSVYGRLWTHLIHLDVDESTYGLIGAVAVLGGVTRMTISLTVIILECTGSILYGLPLMLTLIAARWSGNLFNEGLYDIHIHLRHIPFLEGEPPASGTLLKAKDVMTPHPKCTPLVVRVGYILDLLSETKHHGFPVVAPEEEDRNEDERSLGLRSGPKRRLLFAGLIMRKQLAVLLNEKDFFPERPAPFTRQPPTKSARTNREINRNRFSLSFRRMERAYPRFPDVSGDRSFITEEERRMWLDLSPYVHETPQTTQETSSFTRAYDVFRTSGLRHLVVVNRYNEVTGIITRQDLTPEHVQRCYRLSASKEGHPVTDSESFSRYLFNSKGQKGKEGLGEPLLSKEETSLRNEAV